MVGVQRIFASKMKKVQPEPVQVINQNGHASSIVREFVSSSNPNVQTSQIYSKSLYLTLKKKMWKLYNVICSQMNRCIRKFANFQVSPLFILNQASFREM